MPLFRRDSSKERNQPSSVERRVDQSGINSSLFERLSRRQSSSADGSNQTAPPSHEKGYSPPAPKQGTTSAVPLRSKSHSTSCTNKEHKKEAAQSPSSRSGSEHITSGLTKEDVQALFSGAPNFMLEKGRRGRYFPQAFFPWDNELNITDLQDRVYSKHATFSLATLHAHLPDTGWRPGMAPPDSEPPSTMQSQKLPAFDMGVYERPNMIGLTAVEVGTMALRTYLERPVSDGLYQTTVHEHGKDVDLPETTLVSNPTINLAKTSSTEALRALAHDEGETNIGKHGPKHDRNELMKGGPKAWKAVGIRNITLETLADRLVHLSKVQDDIVANNWQFTVLNMTSEAKSGDYLFCELLYPPSKIIDGMGNRHDLKVQIEALVKVLTTPGAWVNLSLPRERWLFLERLYTTRAEDQSRSDQHGISPGQQRHWNLVQLLLSIELVIRLDAALRLGIASHEIHITPQEIHHFNKLRNLKVDWDLVVARRFASLVYAKKLPSLSAKHEGVSHLQQAQFPPQSPHHDRHGFLDKFRRSYSSDEVEPPYNIGIFPRELKSMAEGLVVFGTHLRWPTIKAVEASLRQQLAVPLQQQEEMLALGVEPLHGEYVPVHDDDTAVVELRPASDATIGGPVSHGWLGGFIIPGYSTPGLLMCTLLENDPEGKPLATLGNKAWPRSGFVWRKRSWWSKASIVGWVMAPIEGTTEVVGWIALPENATPVDSKTGEKFGDGWLLVRANEPKKLREGHRIYDGEALGKESSPLGFGHGKVLSSEFSMVIDDVFDKLPQVDVQNVKLIFEATQQLDRSGQSGEGGKMIYKAAVSAHVLFGAGKTSNSILIPLGYQVRFVAGHPCRPPHGHVKAAETQQEQPHEHRHPIHKHHEHLPGHPLHNTFKFQVKSLEEVLGLDENDWLPNPCDKEAGAGPWVIDARGPHASSNCSDSNLSTTTITANDTREIRSATEETVQNDHEHSEKGEENKEQVDSLVFPRGRGGPGGLREILARAWCAKVGRDAIVSRVGRQCLSCAVREANALEVAIVIRTGGGDT